MEYVLDTSVVIEKIASQLIEKKELQGKNSIDLNSTLIEEAERMKIKC